MFDVRRKFKRFELPLDVGFRTVGDNSDYCPGITKNLCREGISLVSDNFSFSENSLLELKIKNVIEAVTLSCHVVWKKQVGDKWHAGLKFKDIDKSVKYELLSRAYDRWIKEEVNKQ